MPTLPEIQQRDGGLQQLPIWAKLTAYDGSQYYSWTEVMLTSSGWIDKPGGAYGAYSAYPVMSANGVVLITAEYPEPIVQIFRGFFHPTLTWVWVCQDIGANGPPFPTGSACPAITFTKEESYCEDCVENVYRTTVTISQNALTGCLEKTESTPEYVRSNGGCCPGEVVNVYYTDINNFTTFVSNVLYFNQYDENLYININNFWYTFCPCVSGSVPVEKFWYCIDCTNVSDCGTCQTACEMVAPSTTGGVLGHLQSSWGYFDLTEAAYYLSFSDPSGLLEFFLYTGEACDTLVWISDGTDFTSCIDLALTPGTRLWVQILNPDSSPHAFTYTFSEGTCV